MGLRPVHQAVLEFIRAYRRSQNMSPSFRDIESGLGRSRGSVQNSLKRLEAANLIQMQKGKSRSITLVEESLYASSVLPFALTSSIPQSSIERSASGITRPQQAPSRNSARNSVRHKAVRSRTEDTASLPLRGEIAAGFCHEPFTEDKDSWTIDSHCQPADYVLKVSGESMINAGIPDGAYVGIRTVPDGYRPRPGQVVAVWVEGHGTTLKHFYQEGSVVTLIASNPAFGPMNFNLESCQVKIQGVHVFTWQAAQ